MLSTFLRRWASFIFISLICLAFNSVYAAGIVSLHIGNRSNQIQSDVPVTFAQVFKQGDVGGQQPISATLDGQRIPLQVDRKATNADGSLRHALLTAMVPHLAAHAMKNLSLSVGNVSSTGTAVKLDDLLATNFDASVSLQVNGTTFTADARRMLKNANSVNACRPWGRTCNAWLAGPLVGEWIVSGPVKTAGGAANSHLNARFAVRYYPRSGQVRVGVVVGNDWTYVSNPKSITYDARVVVNGQTVYTKADLVHSAHARWRKIFWTGAKPALYVKHDLSYLKATGAIPNFDPKLKIPENVIANYYRRFQRSNTQPMHSSMVMKNMPAPGGREDIGPLPTWTALRLISMDPRLIDVDNTINDLSGSWPIHYRDRATRRPISLEDHPNLTIHGALWRNPGWVSTGGANPYALKPDWSHEPDFGFVPYLLTGDYYYLEELQFWASWNPLTTSPAYRSYEKGLYHWTQIRGQAWSLRTLGQTAYITPDHDPMKGYWKRQIKNNIQWYSAHYVDNLQANKLGLVVHNTPYNNWRGFAPWQDDFFTWSMGYLVNLGFSDAKAMLRYKAKFPVGRMTASGYCFVESSIYTLNLRDSKNGPIYDTFAKAYRESVWPKLLNTSCGSQAMANLIGKRPGQYKAGDLSGYPWNPEGYPANLQPALAAAVNSGIANANRAWQIFKKRPTKPNYSSEPNWDIVPLKASFEAVPKPSVTLMPKTQSIQWGQSATLSWSSENTQECHADWINGPALTGGTIMLRSVHHSGTYTITCSGQNGDVEATSRINVIGSSSLKVSLTASSNLVKPGAWIHLKWNAPQARGCHAPWTRRTGKHNGDWVGPIQQTQTFHITCSNYKHSSSAEVTVNVKGKPKVTLSSANTAVKKGKMITLTWTAKNAQSCSAPWTSSRATSGAESVGPINSERDFTMNCKGPGGSASATFHVKPIQGPVVTVSMYATSRVKKGTWAKVGWHSKNARRCSAPWTNLHGVNNYAWVGPIKASRTFEITCSSYKSQASATVSVAAY